MKILLHICCANCAIYPVKVLRQNNHQVTGFFFNHNIHPYQEFLRRLQAVEEYSQKVELPVLYCKEYFLEEFLAQVAQGPSSRCSFCYLSRLEETARTAAEQGFDGFTSSLLYSRYQQHDTIVSTARELASNYGIPFIYEDFRPGWKEGIEVSKAMGLYRQQYCGCVYSEKDRYYQVPKN